MYFKMPPQQAKQDQEVGSAPPSQNLPIISNSELQEAKPTTTSADDWHPQYFTTLSTIRKGTYSTIHLVQSSHTGQNLYATKTRKKTIIYENGETTSINTEKEISTLAKMEKHPFIIEVFGGFQTPSLIILYLEFCEGGSLFSLLNNGDRFDVARTR